MQEFQPRRRSTRKATQATIMIRATMVNVFICIRGLLQISTCKAPYISYVATVQGKLFVSPWWLGNEADPEVSEEKYSHQHGAGYDHNPKPSMFET